VKINRYLIVEGRLRGQPGVAAWPREDPANVGESWYDVQEGSPEELRQFLTPLNLHPLQLAHCLDSVNDPSVVSFGKSVLMEYPAAFGQHAADRSFLTILIMPSVLVTLRHGLMPALDALVQGLTGDKAPEVIHLPHLLYLILDGFSDVSVDAHIALRGRILRLAKSIAETPAAVSASELSQVRWQVGNLVALIEDQLYCISSLNASDNEALRDPHRKAYIQDLVSETEIAERGMYRLESRVNDLFSDYQVAGNSRVEHRLRLLTIVSAITLPLGLIAGLLGMNVGGVPGITLASGFAIVVAAMALIVLVEYWYFRHAGWFD
jgi:Mg2+ and Co2+ transporter CorA